MEEKYQRSKIYKLLCVDESYYIGATIQPLNICYNTHKKLSSTSGINNAYKHINEIGWDHVTIELIEDFPCKTKKELTNQLNTHILQAKHDNKCLNHIKINNFNKGKIYRIQCNDDRFYIGSTTQILSQRLHHHKQLSKTDNTIFYQHMRKLGWENATIVLIENYPCDTSQELHQQEDIHIAQHIDNPLCLNQNRAFLSDERRQEEMKEYTEEHRQDANERAKQYRMDHYEDVKKKEETYRQTHRKELLEKQRIYAAEHKESIGEYRKKYLQDHKEHVAMQTKVYREAHKDEINAYKLAWAKKKRADGAEEKRRLRMEKKEAYHKLQREVHPCECGGTYQLHHKNRHDSGKKHMSWRNGIIEHTIQHEPND
jgi:hypothetical protein